MKLIVLTSEKEIPNEANVLNSLFKAGLDILHLRKPGSSEKAYSNLLKGIDAKYHDRIVVHQHHLLAKVFKLKGLHIQEHMRLDLEGKLESTIDYFRQEGLTVSTSFHELSEVLRFAELFDYAFLSPVFTSISKVNYLGKGFNVQSASGTIYGMGGISTDNIQQAKDLGYDGVCVLGSIWNCEDPLAAYHQTKQLCDQLGKKTKEELLA